MIFYIHANLLVVNIGNKILLLRRIKNIVTLNITF